MEYHTFSQKDDLLCKLKNYEELKRFVETAVSFWLRMHLKLTESAWLSSRLSSLSPQLLEVITLDFQEFIKSHEQQNLELTREDLYWAIDEICKSIFVSPNPDGDNTKSPKRSNVNKFLEEFFCKESMLERIETNSAKNLYDTIEKLDGIEKRLDAIRKFHEELLNYERVTISLFAETLPTNLGDKVMTNKQEHNRPRGFEIFVNTPLHIGSGTPEHNSTSTYPYVQGSSLKGVIRSLAERLSSYMNYNVHSTDADDWKTEKSLAETRIPPEGVWKLEKADVVISFSQEDRNLLLSLYQRLIDGFFLPGSVKNIPEKSAFENTPDFTYRLLKKWPDCSKAIHDDRENIGIVISPKTTLEDGITMKSDVFAMGIVLYEMLVGAPPICIYNNLWRNERGHSPK
jgi:CRISPR/Cas system CMR subunit Cmr6 (Cas7 group RAMP superfamily)